MFVQVFEAQLANPELWARRCVTWQAEIKPRTTGFQGYTSGVTADGYMVTMARFTSADAARVDSDLPEQGAWMEETSKAFDGDVTFHDSSDVDVILDGPTTTAGFVQVIRGRATDEQAMRKQLAASAGELATARPDVIGGITAWFGDGEFTQVMCFTTEAAARRHEMSSAYHPLLTALRSHVDGELTYLDFAQPDLV